MLISEEFTIQAIKFVHSLLVSIPQYALGSLSAIAILGATPNDAVIMSAYWLEFNRFVEDNDNRAIYNDGGVTILNYRLFGWDAKRMDLTTEQKELMKGCVAEASILDRLSYMVSIYYLIVGILAGIVRAIGPCIKEEWPYIPLILAWTLPAVFRRAIGGIVVVHNPNKRISGLIIISNSPKDKRLNVIETGLFSIAVPWLAVILAYFTTPVGYRCRSRFLTVLCVVWTFNNLVSLFFNIMRIRGKNIRTFVNFYFCISGAFVAFMLLSLVILSNSRPLWVKVFGDFCADPTIPCLSMSDIVNQN
nr:4828_t:CDS:2 [Entrophospora candida]CAG8646211.1 7872_t:CDS:2 [Entrophospora candida]